MVAVCEEMFGFAGVACRVEALVSRNYGLLSLYTHSDFPAQFCSIPHSHFRNETYRQEQANLIRDRFHTLTSDDTSVRAWARMLELRVRGDPADFEALLAIPSHMHP